MPSLFSRSREASTPSKKHSFTPDNSTPALDEFGRISTKLTSLPVSSPAVISKRDKKKTKEQEKRLRAQGSARDRPDTPSFSDPPPLPDGSFLPLSFDRPRTQSETEDTSKHVDYGYLSYERHVVLGLEQVARLVIVISDELATRGGITTPFIFSNAALDISSANIRRLTRAFLATCSHSSAHVAAEAESKWRDEARFAGPHELGMCLRWGLARVVRTVGGHDVRGLIASEHYLQFRDSEAALGYPPTHFSTFLTDLAPSVQSIIISLLTLLSRLTANSTSSGHTPPTLSPLFGPLIFGIGPATLPFHHAYIHYLRAVNAMEHLQLAFIRWQDVPQSSTNFGTQTSLASSSVALGVPIRLKEWIKGYPSTLSCLQEPKNQKPYPRRGARTVRVMTVRRNVRMYSPDLVRTAASWATPNTRLPTPSSRSASDNDSSIYPPGLGENGLLNSKEWERVAPPALKLQPRFSDSFRKRMNMPPGFHPDLGPGTSPMPTMLQAPSISQTTSGSSSVSIGTSISSDEREGGERFRSLTDLKWGEFENLGFGGLGETKLQFDLTESARAERSTKRETLSWNDFSTSGFSRTDGSLSATLQFSSPVATAISTWPVHRAEMSKKLKKTEKSLPPFGWDTEPVVGSEEVIEEAFVDVFCDLVYGGGWMDLERVEEVDRDCNWALMEFKATPPSQTTTSGTADPRTSTLLVLFEEFVPLEYRQQLLITSTSRRRLPSLFTPSKSKQWKQAPTLNGRPYVVGHVPRSPSYRELEFEGLLNGHGGTATKVLTLDRPKSRILSSITAGGHCDTSLPGTPTVIYGNADANKSPTISGPLFIPKEKEDTRLLEVPSLHASGRSEEGHHTDHTSKSSSSISTKRSSRFRFPVPRATPGGRRTGRIPSEYETVDFETRMASYSDDELNHKLENGERVLETEEAKQQRRESKDDAWVDILVGAHTRRMKGQDAEVKDGIEQRRRMINRRSDPDLASLEVAQVLAGVRGRTPSSPSPSVHRQHSPFDRVDGDHPGGLDRFYNDHDVDEIETVPRMSEEPEDDETNGDQHHTDADDEDEEPSEVARLIAESRKRRGYFDLHPERRAVASFGDILLRTSEDDPRERLAHDAESTHSDEAEFQAQEPIPVTPPRKPVTAEPMQKQPHSTIAALKVRLNNPEKTTDLNNLSATVTQSKTAALIEMYRERERNTPPKALIPGAAAASPPVTPPLSPLHPGLSHKEASVPSAPVVEVSTLEESESEPVETPKAIFNDNGRSSPARYVHGAPLHNVMEEDEYED